jgi:two-component system chemotaxis response regulator CheB
MSNLGKPEFVITIGASAGGLNAMTEVVSQLPEEMNAAVFIVLHLSKVGLGDFLIHRLQKYTNYRVKLGENGERIKADHIYVAPPDEHLLVKDGHIVIGQGPTENRWRPSIDVLFRSAAVSYGNRVIGIVLTGFLNDGTSGMSAIKRSGGYCIVQDPNQAEYPDMPLSVLESMEVDFCVPLNKMGATIKGILEKELPEQNTVPAEVVKEAEIAAKVVTSIDNVAKLSTSHSVYACPDCGGGLWNLEDDAIKRYRCHIGHSYTEKDLLVKQGESLEATLWIALRMMEERRSLLMKLSEDDTGKGLSRLALSHKQRAMDLEKHIQKLKEVLFLTKKD